MVLDSWAIRFSIVTEIFEIFRCEPETTTAGNENGTRQIINCMVLTYVDVQYVNGKVHNPRIRKNNPDFQQCRLVYVRFSLT